MKSKNIKTKVVFTKELLNYLDSLGFKCIRSEINIKNPSYRVFIFEDTAELNAVIDEYVKKCQKERFSE